jgi:hypothetical protein
VRLLATRSADLVDEARAMLQAGPFRRLIADRAHAVGGLRADRRAVGATPVIPAVATGSSRSATSGAAIRPARSTQLRHPGESPAEDRPREGRPTGKGHRTLVRIIMRKIIT